MGIYLADQTIIFLQSILVGALLGVFFDAFRISRIAIPTGRAVVFLEDVVFFALCAVITFALMLSAIEGQVRFFLLVGEVIGAVLYNLTLGRLVMAVSKTIIHIVKSILHFIVRCFFRPIWLFFYHLVGLLLCPVHIIANFVKKICLRLKFRLKIGRILLYNHITRPSAKRKKRTGESGGDEKGEETE